MLGSKLGWILSGLTSEIVENSTESSMLIMTHCKGIGKKSTFLKCVDKSLPLKQNLEDFWKLQSIDINDSPVESDNDIALKKFSETLKYDEGRFTWKWPWKEEQPDLPDNRAVSRMRNDTELIQKYADIITD